MKFNALPTQEALRRLFDYDQDRGALLWRVRPEYPKWWNDRFAGRIAGSPIPSGIVVYIGNKPFYAHRLIWVWVHGDVLGQETQIDHRDRDPHRNPIENLREATHGQNRANSQKKRNRDLPKGVYRQTKSGRFQAQIRIDKKLHQIGTYDTAEDAHCAYIAAAIAAKGEFARG